MKKFMKNLSLPISMEDVLRGKSVEWERLEYKAGWNPEGVLHSLCAFANDFHNLGGGYIVIGVAEKNGRPVLPPVGLDPRTIDTIQKELLNLGHSAIQPMYSPISAPCEVDGKWILVIWVPGGETRPYKARVGLSKKSEKEWAYFIRKQSSTVRAKGADEKELISLAATVPFDDRYNQQATTADLSPRLIEEFRNYIKETVVKHPGKIKAERFWNFPHTAIKEALVNAVYHRSYEIREPIEVRISPEELVILSFPGPDRSINMDDLRAGRAVSRRYRNRRLGEFLKELDFTEGRSTGIPKILRAMKANGAHLRFGAPPPLRA